MYTIKEKEEKKMLRWNKIVEILIFLSMSYCYGKLHLNYTNSKKHIEYNNNRTMLIYIRKRKNAGIGSTIKSERWLYNIMIAGHFDRGCGSPPIDQISRDKTMISRGRAKRFAEMLPGVIIIIIYIYSYGTVHPTAVKHKK